MFLKSILVRIQSRGPLANIFDCLNIGMKYRQYTDEDVYIAAAKSTSMRSLLHHLKLKAAGGNYANMKRKLQQLNVDCSHWTGTAWSAGQRKKDWSEYTRASKLKPHLIRLKGHKCERCLLTKWQNVNIPLELHHIDGDRTNNQLENLQLCCPNCHALTDFYRNRK